MFRLSSAVLLPTLHGLFTCNQKGHPTKAAHSWGLPEFNVYVFLLLSMYSYCSSMYSHRCLCILIVVHIFLDTATLTEVFPCFFLGCKANARVKLAKTGHGPHSSSCCAVLCIVCFVSFYVFLFCIVLCIVCFVSFYILFVCKCVLYFCHRVTTQLQLTNIYQSNTF